MICSWVVLAVLAGVSPSHPASPGIAEVQDVVAVDADALRIRETAKGWFFDPAGGPWLT